jgi:hypothetical protein
MVEDCHRCGLGHVDDTLRCASEVSSRHNVSDWFEKHTSTFQYLLHELKWVCCSCVAKKLQLATVATPIRRTARIAAQVLSNTTASDRQIHVVSNAIWYYPCTSCL